MYVFMHLTTHPTETIKKNGWTVNVSIVTGAALHSQKFLCRGNGMDFVDLTFYS